MLEIGPKVINSAVQSSSFNHGEVVQLCRLTLGIFIFANTWVYQRLFKLRHSILVMQLIDMCIK